VSDVTLEKKVRDAQTIRWIESVMQDIRFAIRSLRRSPGFTSVAVLTLALGIGANTAIFSVVHAVLLRPLPFTDSDKVVYIVGNVPSRPEVMTMRVPMSDLPRLRSESRTLSNFSTMSVQPTTLTWTGSIDPVKTSRASISPAVFEFLATRPIVGRVFASSEEQPGSQLVAMLSYSIWQTHFAADPTIVGRSITLDGMTHTVTGVMPRGFAFPTPEVHVWSAMQLPPSANLVALIIARVKDGVSIETAAAEINTVFIRMHQRQPQGDTGGAPPPLRLISVKEQMIAPVRQALLVMLGAVGLVLLISCSNIASLLLARSVARRREIEIRISLGAGPGRLVRQVLTESVVLALLGGMAGSLIAFGGVRLLALDSEIPRLAEVRVDISFLLVVLMTSICTGLLFGSAPAGRLARFRFEQAVVGKNVSAVSLLGRNRARNVLTVFQVGMAVVLLTGAGLLGGSFVNLARVELGYDTDRVLTFEVPMPRGRYNDEERNAIQEALIERLKAINGIVAAAITDRLPTQPGGAFAGLLQVPGTLARIPVQLRPVSSDYFDVMRLRLVEGRTFEDTDRPGQAISLIVSQQVAAGFPEGRLLGKIVRLNGPFEAFDMHVVGIARNVLTSGLEQTPRADVYVKLEQWPAEPRFQSMLRSMRFVIRAENNPMRLVPTIRSLVVQTDQRLFIDNISTMQQLVANTTARPRTYALLLGVFSLVAVLLAGVGIYGLTAYIVTERTREIGIRMALGAERADVVRLVLSHSSSLGGLGIILGLAGAAAVTRYLDKLLFGLSPLDPRIFATVPVVFILIILAASYVPTRRATKVDPLVALRCE
jgi:predicted permease